MLKTDISETVHLKKNFKNSKDAQAQYYEDRSSWQRRYSGHGEVVVDDVLMHTPHHKDNPHKSSKAREIEIRTHLVLAVAVTSRGTTGHFECWKGGDGTSCELGIGCRWLSRVRKEKEKRGSISLWSRVLISKQHCGKRV